MKRIFVALAVAAVVTAPGLVPAAVAQQAAQPAFSPLPAETDPAAQQVYAALVAFFDTSHRWPRDLNELSAFATMRGLPLDLKAFRQTTYSVSDIPGRSTAGFGYTLASGTRSAFALSATIGQ